MVFVLRRRIAESVAVVRKKLTYLVGRSQLFRGEAHLTGDVSWEISRPKFRVRTSSTPSVFLYGGDE